MARIEQFISHIRPSVRAFAVPDGLAYRKRPSFTMRKHLQSETVVLLL